SQPVSTARQYHQQIEAMKRAYADRARFLGDSDQVYVPVEALLSDRYLTMLAAGVSSEATYGYESTLHVDNIAAVAAPSAAEGSDTTHYSIVDARGNIVSAT